MRFQETLRLAVGFLLFAGGAVMAIEEPKFQIVDTLSDIEIRRLDAYWTVEIEITAEEGAAGNLAFRPLLKYISGENKGAEKIAMTAPVNQQPVGEKISMTAPVNQEQRAPGKYAVSFVLPAIYNNKRPPEPTDSRLVLRQVPARMVAVIRYRGTWSTERMAEYRNKMMDVLGKQTRWTPTGTPTWSRYDPPFMPWFLRRNEVQIEVTENPNRSARPK
jgi:hypothetical protein